MENTKLSRAAEAAANAIDDLILEIETQEEEKKKVGSELEDAKSTIEDLKEEIEDLRERLEDAHNSE